MATRVGKRTVAFDNVNLLSSAAIGGKKEGEGPLSSWFDKINYDEYLGTTSFEKAESMLQKNALDLAIQKAKIKAEDIDYVFAGDLLNQCIGSSFGIRDMGLPFLGLYGACSTMALSVGLASVFVDSGAARLAAAVTSSHFCSSERQFRFPLEYGSQRTPTAQWTATASGAVLLTTKECEIKIKHYTAGEIVDLGIKDANNMGAAMAPDDVKIRPYPKNEGMVFFYTQIQYLRGLEHFLNISNRINYIEKIGSKFHALCESFS